MRVLVSNDDGVDAPGIRVLAARLAEVGEVTVVAPDRDRSGASNSLTLDAPIRIARLDDGRYRVAGTHRVRLAKSRQPSSRRRPGPILILGRESKMDSGLRRNDERVAFAGMTSLWASPE